MATFLLTWNPLKWHWQDLDTLSKAIREGQTASRRWSCGNSKRIKRGDRLFMIALGASTEIEKGIFASGIALRDSFSEPHWDKEKRLQGVTSQYTIVLFDTLFNPFEEVGLPRELLNYPPFDNVNWSTQSSGISIPENVAQHLEAMWLPIAKSANDSHDLNDFVQGDENYFEGTAYQLTLTRYERNKQARLVCLQHYGTVCLICGFDFEEKYGELGAGFIHVHHITPLSEINAEYAVDPIRDLKPVCPNCHAMIHRRTPPFKIDEIKSMLSKKLG
jgi:5-methylcytosine-specific restriction protein A